MYLKGEEDMKVKLIQLLLQFISCQFVILFGYSLSVPYMLLSSQAAISILSLPYHSYSSFIILLALPMIS